MAEVDKLDVCPFVKGTGGLRNVLVLSTPKDELLLEFPSKCPERFSLSVAVNAKPESLRERGVDGIDGKFPDTGDKDEGGLVLLLVDGRSTRV